MKTAAIIAEYNPFHNGHLYLLEQTRRQTGADFVLAVMSGNFVQRGAPALADKFIRTQMALSCGVDVVIELPVLYATSSAEYFAGGAVSLLNRLHVIDVLSFGSECGNLALLQKCAQLLVNEDERLQEEINFYLKKGFSYPLARKQALSDALSVPDADPLLSSPNNILGIEYCKALRASHSSIHPFTLKRKGADYHSVSFPDTAGSCADDTRRLSDAGTGHTSATDYASASAIRHALIENPGAVAQWVPPGIFRILTEKGLLSTPISEERFSLLLHYKLLSEKEEGFSSYLDCNEALSDRIVKNLPLFSGFQDFCRILKSKDHTYTRISRMLLHILLNIKTPDFFLPPLKERVLFTPYARLLGFRKSAAPLLSAIRKNSSIPLVSKMGDAHYLMDEPSFALLRQEVFCGGIYALAQPGNIPPVPNEFRQSPIILP